jgi:hypothetical protein
MLQSKRWVAHFLYISTFSRHLRKRERRHRKMLTVTVNRRQTFRANSIACAKQQATKVANKCARKEDWARIYVSSGSVTIDGKEYPPGSEVWLKRFNTMYPMFKPGKWVM